MNGTGKIDNDIILPKRWDTGSLFEGILLDFAMASPSIRARHAHPALLTLEDRLTPASAGSLESVTNLYRLTLNRLPDAGGLAHFASRLDAGEPVAAVTASLLGSAEHREKIVTGYYQGILNRAPDSAGLASHVATLGKGASEERLVAAMLASTEKAGTLTDEAFVDLLYQSVFGRSADQGGRYSHSKALESGTSRQSLALAFLESPEASATVVDRLYSQLLGRTPGFSERIGWIKALGRPVFSYADAVAGFVSSPEGSSRLAVPSPLVATNATNPFFWQQHIGLNHLGGVVKATSPAPYVYFLDANPTGNSSLTPSGYAVVIDGAPATRDPIATSGRLTGVTVEFTGGVDPSHVSWTTVQPAIACWTGDIANQADRQQLAVNILTAAMGGSGAFADFPTLDELKTTAGNLIWAQDFEAHIDACHGQGSPEEVAAGILAVTWAGREILGGAIKIVPVPASAIVKGEPALGGPWNLGTVLSSANYLAKLSLAQTMPEDMIAQLPTMDLLSALHLATAGGLPLIDGVLIQQYGASPPGSPSADTPAFTDTTLPYAVLSSLYGDPSQFDPNNPPATPWNSYYFGDMPFTAGVYWAGNTVTGITGFDPAKFLTPTLATTTWNGHTPIPAGT